DWSVFLKGLPEDADGDLLQELLLAAPPSPMAQAVLTRSTGDLQSRVLEILSLPEFQLA
ncbi:MAG TPA: DUF1800 domain-containing protein, partial [Cytophagales bacterium]|nr:DUF1800 domain-containing protein [Cytophagales bacterium]